MYDSGEGEGQNPHRKLENSWARSKPSHSLNSQRNTYSGLQNVVIHWLVN